jgi:Zn-dependent M28 family amino/carboxypeptidase
MRPFAVFFALICATCGTSASFAEAKLEKRLRGHVEILASDAFEGRAPGTGGEQKSIKYIADTWRALKLRPAANDGSWFEPVALVDRRPESSKFAFFQSGHRLSFAADEIILLGREKNYQASALPLVFVGYGVSQDGQAISGVAGKLVLMLTNARGNGSVSAQSVETRRHALVKAGAEGVLLVADGDEGSWPAIRRQLMSKTTALQNDEIRAPLQGAISSEFAVALVTAAKKDWDGLRKAAAKPGYLSEDLGITADFDVSTNVNRFNSMNVIGKIPARNKTSGAVLFMAHWDHLGICRPEGDTDRICNGAVDNASGIAVLTEVARGLAKKRHDREIYFVATTAEESGLYGAYSFAANPPVALDQIVVALNVDTIAVAPAGSKVAIIGRGTTKLDQAIESIAAKLGRKVEPSDQANSFLKRQDGWALTQKGVPALMINSSFSDIPFLEKYMGSLYHGPDDEISGALDLAGTAEDTELHIALGKYFASRQQHAGNRTGS